MSDFDRDQARVRRDCKLRLLRDVRRLGRAAAHTATDGHSAGPAEV